MTSTISAFAPVAVPLAKRAVPNLARADLFNRLYVSAMFVVIIAIGSWGIFAIAEGKASDALVAQTFEHANDVTEMGTAVDREYFEVLSQIRQRQGTESDRLLRGPGLVRCDEPQPRGE